MGDLELKVRDILPANLANLKVVLILESPHTDEFIHQHPLAGASGKSVTKYIKGKVSVNSPIRHFSKALGCELKANPNIQELGIMNFSLYPLDQNFYYRNNLIKSTFNHRHIKTVEAFRIIKKSPKYKTRNNNCTVLGKYVAQVEKYLLKSFEKRIIHVYSLNNRVIFVPCGKVAEAFLNKTGILIPQQNIIQGVDHPSRNRWSNLSNAAFDTELAKL